VPCYVNLIIPSEADLKRHTHAKLLADVHFFEEVNPGVFRLTNQGHDYLAAIRDENIWTRTKSAASAAGGVGLGIMRDIAIAYLKEELRSRTGLSI
jgi:hypothetical protein